MGNGVTATVNPDRVLKDLKELWAQLAQDQADAGGVLKACSMTLVAVPESGGDADRLRQTLAVLMHDHPSRAIVVHPQEGHELEARVFAECWKPFGKNQQICAEGVEVLAGPGALMDVARLVVPLRVPDLPLVLWCRGREAFSTSSAKMLDPLFGIANKVIFDSQGVEDAAGAIASLRELRSPVRRVADLHWARLSGWREVVAHLFDDQAMKPKQVKSVEIGYGREHISTCALYAAAWIRTGLPGIPVEVTSNSGSPGLNHMVFHATGKNLRLDRDEGHVQVEGCGRSYASPLPPASDEYLMREELSILGFDPVWERVLGHE